MMKIIKYKKGTRGLYKVELDDGRCLALYEEVIFDIYYFTLLFLIDFNLLIIFLNFS